MDVCSWPGILSIHYILRLPRQWHLLSCGLCRAKKWLKVITFEGSAVSSLVILIQQRSAPYPWKPIYKASLTVRNLVSSRLRWRTSIPLVDILLLSLRPALPTYMYVAPESPLRLTVKSHYTTPKMCLGCANRLGFSYLVCQNWMARFSTSSINASFMRESVDTY